jgi:ribosome-associated protein
MQEKPTAVVGLGHSHWVAMDYGNVLVHIFLPETRSFYDLENLWEDAILTEVPDID